MLSVDNFYDGEINQWYVLKRLKLFNFEEIFNDGAI